MIKEIQHLLFTRYSKNTQTYYSVGFKVIEFPLNKDFASFKNNLKDACSGDYIFQIDADEYPDDYLMATVEEVIKMNDSVDVFWIPRINKVDGLNPRTY